MALQDRFFIVENDAPEVTLDVQAQVDNPSVVGSFGFLQVRLEEDPAISNNQGITLAGTVTINLTDPGAGDDHDGRIFLNEFRPDSLTDLFDVKIDAKFDIDGLRVSADAGVSTTLAAIQISLDGDGPGHVRSLADLVNLVDGVRGRDGGHPGEVPGRLRVPRRHQRGADGVLQRAQ